MESTLQLRVRTHLLAQILLDLQVYHQTLMIQLIQNLLALMVYYQFKIQFIVMLLIGSSHLLMFWLHLLCFVKHLLCLYL